MYEMTKQLLLGRPLSAAVLVLATGATGTVQAHDTYQLTEVNTYTPVSITEDGLIGANGPSSSNAILEGSIIIRSMTDAVLHDVNSNGESVGQLTTTGLAYYDDGVSTQSWWGLTLAAISEIGIMAGSTGPTGTAMTWNGAWGTSLPMPSGWVTSSAVAISDNGRFVVGSGQDPSLWTTALLWDRQQPGTVLELDDTVSLTQGGSVSAQSHAVGVNDEGDVIGDIGGWPVRWTAASNWTAQHLGTPDPMTTCHASAINDDGIIVGYCDPSKAFIWHPGDTSLTWLIDEVDPVSSSGWTLGQALDINDIGQVVGWGWDPTGAYAGFILSPEGACLRPCTFSDGTTWQLPIAQCESLNGELPWGVTYCIKETGPTAPVGPAIGP